MCLNFLRKNGENIIMLLINVMMILLMVQDVSNAGKILLLICTSEYGQNLQIKYLLPRL